MDASHIAIITLHSRAKELEEQKKSMEAERQKLNRQIMETASQIKDLYFAINSLQSGNAPPSKAVHPQIKRTDPDNKAPLFMATHNAEAYPFKGSLTDKVLYILHQQKRFLHSREIAEYIVVNEPDKEVERVLELISKQVARYKRNNMITSVTDNSGRHTFYGLPEWLDANKQPLRGYGYTFTPMKRERIGGRPFVLRG